MVRDSASAVQRELLECYALIERLGRGVVCVRLHPVPCMDPAWAAGMLQTACRRDGLVHVACMPCMDSREDTFLSCWHGPAQVARQCGPCPGVGA